ncbi:protein translocase subunit SecD [Ruminiclostridium cellulolyticum]|uniref:Protein translocase subunit SecD n=1 Tax=Ruminiclostridium cellulolyticum (strain ATCC 35319 / DSM 5812 / JCM 6584 / H10) TaxID=394503 RepID=B8I6M6_RUMCH|nr:protein translocase subunit SecD [Ruminiclostridium cellulolyticum]ACL74918.1 protein-export membrane protein SecD [Ruminiclostridium cellulolyticum H10]
MRGSNAVKFFSILVIIGILTWIAAYGSILGVEIPGVRDIRTGIDIQGGVDARLYAVTKDNSKPKAEDLDAARIIIGKRLDSKNIFDRVITVDKDKGYVLVQIPHKKGEAFDPQRSIEEIGKTALLTFQEVDESKKDSNGYLPTGKIILEGSDVKEASAEVDGENGGYCVALTLTSEGGKKFSEATGRLIGKPIAIFMDNDLISAPNVQTQISGNSARITLGGTASNEQRDEAKNLAGLIKSGSLPFKLEARQVNNISPTLGSNALKVSIEAFIVALILICLFMIFYYRLPGLIASIALILHTVMELLALSWTNIIVTLPGIAGLILTVGMAVDANVIIFERIKDELKNGKTLRAAIDVGFKRAFSAVLDSNITTLISAVVLWKFGSGPIQSFAYTLGIGVVLSFLTAVTASRIMLQSIQDLEVAKHHWLYGVSMRGGKANG